MRKERKRYTGEEKVVILRPCFSAAEQLGGEYPSCLFLFTT
jgi:hypothetical protein